MKDYFIHQRIRILSAAARISDEVMKPEFMKNIDRLNVEREFIKVKDELDLCYRIGKETGIKTHKETVRSAGGYDKISRVKIKEGEQNKYIIKRINQKDIYKIFCKKVEIHTVFRWEMMKILIDEHMKQGKNYDLARNSLDVQRQENAIKKFIVSKLKALVNQFYQCGYYDGMDEEDLKYAD